MKEQKYRCAIACVFKDKIRKAKAQNEKPDRREQTVETQNAIQLAVRKELRFCSGEIES